MSEIENLGTMLEQYDPERFEVSHLTSPTNKDDDDDDANDCGAGCLKCGQCNRYAKCDAVCVCRDGFVGDGYNCEGELALVPGHTYINIISKYF